MAALLRRADADIRAFGRTEPAEKAMAGVLRVAHQDRARIWFLKNDSSIRLDTLIGHWPELFDRTAKEVSGGT